MKTIKVEVKRKHIKAGAIGEAHSCPIALALKEIGMVSPIAWGCGSLEFKDKAGVFVSEYMPESAREFIYAFDSEKPVKPFSFQLKYEA